MKTFTQFLEQRDPNFLKEMDRRGFLGAIGDAGAADIAGSIAAGKLAVTEGQAVVAVTA